MIIDPENMAATQLQLLQATDKAGRELIAGVVLIMFDCDSARLLLQHFKEEMAPATASLLQEMLDFDAHIDAQEAAHAQKH
jgi:hypothetical protein